LLKEMHEHCLLWNRRHEIVFASIKYELIHFVKNIAKFDMQTSIKMCDVVKQSTNQIKMLKVQIDSKLKWRAYLRNIQKKMTTQSLTFSRLTAFTWEACFARIKLIYTMIIRSIIIYDSIIWYASHERSNSVVATTKKFDKFQQQSLRVISDSFKAISMQILETKTHVQSIQLHMTRLQMSFKQRMKIHKHDTLIRDFCEQIKHRLFETRERRRWKAHETSAERKIKWTLKMCIKLFEKKKAFHLTKLSSSSFWQNENSCDARIKREIDAKSARRWWRTLRLRKWNCTKTWQNWKILSSCIWKRNESN
jgi:hypothetical protein